MPISRNSIITFAACLWILSSFASSLLAQDQASTIFVNGKILTIATDSGDFPIAEAVAVKGDKILAVGSNADILKLAGPTTIKVDLQGKAMLPGLYNTHKHPNRDALMNYYYYLPIKYQKSVVAAGMVFDWRNKKNVLHTIEQITKAADPSLPVVVIGGRGMLGYVGYGASLLVNAPSPGLADSREIGSRQFPQLGLTIPELDSVSSGRAVMIVLGVGGMMNTKAIELAKSKGVLPTGNGGVGRANFSPEKSACCLDSLLPQPTPELLAPLYKMELKEKNAPYGYTTLSSQFTANEVAAFGVLDQKGDLPLRVGYALSPPNRLANFDRGVQRLKEIEQKYNSDKLWLSGLGGVPGLGTAVDDGHTCASFPREPGISEDYLFTTDDCYDWNRPNDETLEILKRLNIMGYRFSNMHTWGNLGVEQALDFYKKIDKDRPLKGRRFAFDHTSIMSPKIIKLSQELGIYWSMIPTAFATQRGMMMREVFGGEMTDAWGTPAKKLVDAGLKVTFEGEFEAGNPWKGLQFMVTRVDSTATVRGYQNAVDRKTGLRILTRWGAEYVMQDKKLGTIEPGKLADLIVVDKNPLDPNLPDDQLGTINVLMTMVGGKVVFRHTDFEM